jgi:hypothetical protein
MKAKTKFRKDIEINDPGFWRFLENHRHGSEKKWEMVLKRLTGYKPKKRR